MFDVNSGPVLYSTPDLLAIVFLGVIGGVLGSLYNYLVDKVLRTYSIINEYVISQQVNTFVISFLCVYCYEAVPKSLRVIFR